MTQLGLPFLEVLDFVRSRREQVHPNDGFRMQLARFERERRDKLMSELRSDKDFNPTLLEADRLQVMRATKLPDETIEAQRMKLRQMFADRKDEAGGNFGLGWLVDEEDWLEDEEKP